MSSHRNKRRITPKHLDPKYLMFSVFTANDIRNLSVAKIGTPQSFSILGHPLKGGLYDPSLGPLMGNSEPCGTCGGTLHTCPGHFGHIELAIPVVNPLFHNTLRMLMKLSCLTCFTFQIAPHVKLLLHAKWKLLRKGQLSDIDGLDQEVQSEVVSNLPSVPEAQTEYIAAFIDDYMQQLYNRKKQKYGASQNPEDPTSNNTKNINMQWQAYVESALKEHTVGKMCVNCHGVIPKISVVQNKIMTTKLNDSSPNSSKEAMSNTVVHKLETVMIMPDQSKEHLREIWKNEKDFLELIIPCLGLMDLEYPTDMFFLEVVPVLPPIVRPVNILHGQMIEHPQTQVYKNIIEDCLVLRNIIRTIQDGGTDQLPEEGRLVFEQIRGLTATEKLHNAWQGLQANVDHLMDRDTNRTAESMHCQGLKQVIEKKEGVIRMHMMGKRVNFAARSVITPDPNLNIDEIGVPEAFAAKLTYPVPVTPWNVVELRRLVLNGPDVYPGAAMVENEDGMVQAISSRDPAKREAIAKRLLMTGNRNNKFFNGVKVVHRHLQNGDVLLLNRQPTLHKPSIMAHKARVLKGEKTLRLHYANCKAYNADFDGDEMNAHFPQNELARSEGYNLASVSKQYLVPKDGTPLSGLIQDHIVSGVRLTSRGRLFSKLDYTQLVYTALPMKQGKLVLLPPAIIKPELQWSGKQILSTVIINVIPEGRARINLTSTTKISPKEWQTREPRRWKCGEKFTDPKTMSEAEVIVRHGELLCGVLDKMHYGATPYGLVHCIYELYGGECVSTLLSAFGKLFQAYLQWDGFTLGIQDILLTPAAEEERKRIVSRSKAIGDTVHRSVLEAADDAPANEIKNKVEESYLNNPKFRMQIDRKYKSVLDVYTNEINKTCVPAGLLNKFPENNLQFMVQSGAKGSMVNTTQISCLLGQIELEGKRPPLMISGKSLPCFRPYDPSPRAGGFITGRFMTGIKPQEFFFHCMAGREGLIDTAVKTSRSGYLQRCLIKHLEGLVVNYDSTVRDSDGSLIQFRYGEDGLDVPGSRFLRKEQMPFLVDNKDAIVDAETLDALKTNSSNRERIKKLAKRIKKWRTENGLPLEKRRTSAFSKFSAENAIQSSNSKRKNVEKNSGRTKAALSLIKKWTKAGEDVKKEFRVRCTKCPDPITSTYRQDVDFGVITERLEDLMQEYLSTSSNISRKNLKDLLSMKVMKTISPPGEPVGLLAAQSIGEPSTQMTLNTFHFAGRGDMNVTLGIPRLREILMMASKNIKTPSMEIPFRNDLPNLEKQSKKLRVKLTKCMLSDVLKTIVIDRKMEEAPHRRLVCTVNIEFLPYKYYKGEFSVRPQDVMKHTEETFFKNVFREIKKVAKVTGTLLYFQENNTKKRMNDENAMLDQADPDEEEGVRGERGEGMRDNLGETHESSDEEDAAEDADATMNRTISRHRENQEYEDPEEEEIEVALNDEDADYNSANKVPSNNGYGDDDDDSDDMMELNHRRNDKRNSNRKSDVVNMYTNALEYDYDESKHLSWCRFKFWLPLKMIKLDLSVIIRNAASKTVLWETPSIKKAFIFQNNEGETILKTDGINITEMLKCDKILNLKKLYSNDIYNISQMYGIEAANRVIVKEIKDVFKMYGITVDSRHLSLIADYMTFDGTFQPLSRKGMENSASPLQQISFESSLNFLKSATLQRKRDDLMSPSSRLMLGQPCKSGTGTCSLLIDMKNDSFM